MGRIIRDIPNTGKLTEIGKIKIGDKKISQSGKEYPVSLDYFRATGEYSKMFNEKFGEKCTNIPIVFASDNIDTVCNENYELRDKAGRLVADGNGKEWRVYNPETEKYVQTTATLEQIEAQTKLKAKVKLTLRFLILDIKVLGLWRFETYGVASTIPQVRDTFDFVQQTAGTIVNIPFDLQVKKVKSQKPGVASQYTVVSLVPNLSPEHAEKLHNFLQAGNKVQGLLTEDKLNRLELGPVIEQPEQPEQAQEPEYVPFEEVKDSELEIAIKGIKECQSFAEVAAHWKAHKSFQPNAEYIAAKDEMKLKFEK